MLKPVLLVTAWPNAEQLVKDAPQGLYCIAAGGSASYADYSGFECRWKDIPSPYDETDSLLVMSVANTMAESVKIYLDLLDEIQNIYGAAETYKPVQKNQLILTTRKQDLQDEVNIRTASKSKFGTLIYTCLLPWKVRIGKFLMDKGLYFQSADWENYKETLIANTNFRKFDDNLRMVISGSARQRKALDQYLAEQYRKGLLAYSMRVSNRALMTCMISDYKLYHIHFVDGADGGYTMASMMLKQQLNSVSKIS